MNQEHLDILADIQLMMSNIQPSVPDRVTAITSSSYVDKYLGMAIEHALPCLTPKLTKQIFSDRGALSTFSARSDLAAALGLIDGETYRDVQRMRKIRNMFAHDLSLENFDDSRVSTLIDGMSRGVSLVKSLSQEQGRSAEASQGTMSRRSKFVFHAFTICSLVSTKLLIKAANTKTL